MTLIQVRQIEGLCKTVSEFLRICKQIQHCLTWLEFVIIPGIRFCNIQKLIQSAPHTVDRIKNHS